MGSFGVRRRRSAAASLERYRPIIPDFSRFLTVASAPEPVTLRPRAGRLSPDDLLARLESRGFRLVPLEAPSGFYRVAREPYPVSRTLEHWLGLFYLQQAVMGLPAVALGVKPGDRVLDLCAAPGGKTSHLAEMLGDAGGLVAADSQEKRLRALLGNLYRLGHTGVIVVAADGRTFPSGAEFDAVLVDAPCSGEGNLRSRGGGSRPLAPSFLDRVTRAQEALLRRALDLVRPGGRVLYATCTFAPEENERVVDAVLADGTASLEPIAVDAPHAPGLAEWQGRRFHPDLALAWRVYPHHLDSGGLFMALLKRHSGDRDRSRGDKGGWTPVPTVFSSVAGQSPEGRERETEEREAQARIEEALARIGERFGLDPKAGRAFRYMVRGGHIWTHGCPAWPIPAWKPGGHWRFVALGMRAFRLDRRFGPVPTNDFLVRMGPALTRNLVRMDRPGFRKLLGEGTLSAADGVADLPPGIVALHVDGYVVGRGFVGRRGVTHEIPRGRASDLAAALGAPVAGPPPASESPGAG